MKQTQPSQTRAAAIAAPVYSYTLTIMPPFSSTIDTGPDIPLLFMSLVFSLPGLIEWKKEHENRKEPLMSTHNKP
ncbi:hypothetical protein, partial [Faecalibaculum rodentium]|uniref:hypothetical protein n=1 Tax=Faecalibaculum rodentium TaxID=1702221 RepID=UPI0026016B05